MPSPGVAVELRVEVPRGRQALAAHAIDVLFTRCLGWTVTLVEGDHEHAVVVGPDGRRCTLVSPFLAMPEAAWREPESLPTPSAEVWTGRVADGLPALWGRKGREEFVRTDNDDGVLHVDVLGLSAMLLTRYEEFVVDERDEHGRFAAAGSLAAQCGWLQRPLVDEASEVLYRALRSLWPHLPEPSRQFTIERSHDVDHPFRYVHGALRSARYAVRDVVRDVWRPGQLARTLGRVVASRAGWDRFDPYYSFDALLALAERWGSRHVFFLFGGLTDRRRDAKYSPSEARLRRLLGRLHSAGHEIGLHPSYGSSDRPGQIEAEARALEGAMRLAGVKQPLRASRQHFLRVDVPRTHREVFKAGLTVESSMGFADAIGFRAGICRPYPWFDLDLDRRTGLEIHPLSVMEVTVFRDGYMGLGETATAVDAMRDVRAVCERFGGVFSLLWHNDNLVTPHQLEMYEAVAAP